MSNVAKLAGVSLSTVSRVINDRPRVAPSTVESVRRAMAELKFIPNPRRSAAAPRQKETSPRIAFVVLGHNSNVTPGFERLLRGLSDASTSFDVQISFDFQQNLNRLPPIMTKNEVAGVLLLGQCPDAAVRKQFEVLPTVWLMANPERPTWGDQVMPDNTRVGEIAARYLVNRGHEHVAYLNCTQHSWGFDIRTLFFKIFAENLGSRVTELKVADLPEKPTEPRAIMHQLVQKLLKLTPRPTGLFVLEDCLLPTLQTTFADFGITSGPGGDFDLISCNNERQYFVGLRHAPATIDIRTEAIARRGVEQILWQLAHRDCDDRTRITVEPVLVPEETQS